MGQQRGDVGHDQSQPVRPHEWNSVPATDITWTDTHDIRKAVGVTPGSGTSCHFNSFTAMLAMVTSNSPEYLQTEQVRAAVFAAQRVTWDATAPVLLQVGNTYCFGLNDATQYSEFGRLRAQRTILESCRIGPAGNCSWYASATRAYRTMPRYATADSSSTMDTPAAVATRTSRTRLSSTRWTSCVFWSASALISSDDACICSCSGNRIFKRHRAPQEWA